MHRRNFLKQSGMLAFGSAMLARNGWELASMRPALPPPGLQLFTLFATFDNDVPGNLEKIATIGYKEIESAFSRKGGFYGMTAREFGRLLADKGLEWKSHHVLGAPFRMGAGSTGPKTLKENAQELVDTVAEAGVPFMVCASIPLGKKEEISEAVEILSKTGEACKKAGIGFCYHNHEGEFKDVEGQIPYHVLLSQIPADIMKMELDLAWSTHAGINPVDLFTQHPGRFPLWHVKDLNKETGRPVEVGAGYIDFKPIFAAADKAGLRYFFVEQDGAPQPFENIATSLHNLKKFM